MAKNIADKTAQPIVAKAVSEPKFNFILQVINPFQKYHKGALIASDDAIQFVIDNGYAVNCNRLARK